MRNVAAGIIRSVLTLASGKTQARPSTFIGVAARNGRGSVITPVTADAATVADPPR